MATSTKDKVTQRVPFRMIQMPCCGFIFCNVNARWPTYCIECGKFVFDKVKGSVMINDQNAELRYDSSQRP